MSAFVGKGARAAFGGGSSAAPSKTGCTAGNLVVLYVGISRGDTANTAIAAPSGWTAAQNPAGPSIAGSPNYTPVVAIFYKLSSAGGTESATVAGPGGTYGWAQIAEFSGGPFTFTGAQSANGIFNATAASRATGTTGANSIADAVVIAVGHPEDTVGSVTALGTPSTYTSLDLEAANNAEVAWSAAYKLLSSTGTQSATHSWTTNAYYSGCIAIFEGPAPAGGITGAGQIASGGAIGSSSIAAAVAPAGIASAQALGGPVVGASVAPTGIGSTEALGSAAVGASVATAGVSTLEAIGGAALGASVVVGGIATSEAMGLPQLGAAVVPVGLATGEAVGAPALGAAIAAGSVSSGEAPGAPALSATVSAAGAASAEVFGLPVINGQGVAAAGIASAEAMGSPAIAASLDIAGVPSAAALGMPSIASSIVLPSIPSGESIGLPAIGGGAAEQILCLGVATAEAFGAPRVGDYFFVRTKRTLDVRDEDRAFELFDEDRAYQLPPENRTYGVRP